MTSANLNTGNMIVDLDVQLNKAGEEHPCVVSSSHGTPGWVDHGTYIRN